MHAEGEQPFPYNHILIQGRGTHEHPTASSVAAGLTRCQQWTHFSRHVESAWQSRCVSDDWAGCPL